MQSDNEYWDDFIIEETRNKNKEHRELLFHALTIKHLAIQV